MHRYVLVSLSWYNRELNLRFLNKHLHQTSNSKSFKFYMSFYHNSFLLSDNFTLNSQIKLKPLSFITQIFSYSKLSLMLNIPVEVESNFNLSVNALNFSRMGVSKSHSDFFSLYSFKSHNLGLAFLKNLRNYKTSNNKFTKKHRLFDAMFFDNLSSTYLNFSNETAKIAFNSAEIKFLPDRFDVSKSFIASEYSQSSFFNFFDNKLPIFYDALNGGIKNNIYETLLNVSNSYFMQSNLILLERQALNYVVLRNFMSVSCIKIFFGNKKI